MPATRCHLRLFHLLIVLMATNPAFSLGALNWDFSDNFEYSLSSWLMFEEVVNSCYGTGIGRVEAIQGAAFEGASGLSVASNVAGSLYSNHVIAYRNIKPVSSGLWTYELHAQLPLEYALTSQVGPEFSVQNTREVGGGGTTTSIAGIQHIASVHVLEKWNIWIEMSPNVASWRSIAASAWPDSVPVVISPGDWFKYILEIDYTKNEYISLTVVNVQTGQSTEANLRGLKIAAELRYFETATVLTLEAENLYNNCGTAGAFTSIMLYDTVKFKQLSSTESDFELTWTYDFTQSRANLEKEIDVYQGNFKSSSNSYFLKDNALVENGQLKLKVNMDSNPEGRAYSTAAVSTSSQHAQIYGRWEVEAMCPQGFGLTGYIGLLATDKSWPPEVAFAEVIGRAPSKLFLTQHYGIWPDHHQDRVSRKPPFDAPDLTQAFHVYALEWKPSGFRYLVDGIEVLKQSNKFSAQLMDLAIGVDTGDCGSWADCPENSSRSFSPSTMTVNYVKIYAYRPTKLETIYENKFKWNIWPDGWVMEETVPDSRYQYGLGLIELRRRAAWRGWAGIAIRANTKRENYMNRVSAVKHLLGTAIIGYGALSVMCYIPYESFETIRFGPSLLISNTRKSSAGGFETQHSGVQYDTAHAKWSIWSYETTSWTELHDAGSDPLPVLSYNRWYKLMIVMNYQTSSYEALRVFDSNGRLIATKPLTSFKCGREQHSVLGEAGGRLGVTLTLTAENANEHDSSDTASSGEAQVFYDQVVLRAS